MSYKMRLKIVTPENWRELCNLKVADNQQHTIETNKDSLLEAAYDSKLNWHPFGIYLQDKPIGFTMIGALDETPGTIWLDRLMIDQQYQGKKYGQHALQLIITYIVTHYPNKDILLSVHPENRVAITFYGKFEFYNTDTTDENGEIIFKKTVNKTTKST